MAQPDECPSTLCVLAVDSNLEFLDFVEEKCNQYGNKVIPFSESLRAADVIRRSKRRIDLILIELHMPIMDGYEFLQFLRKEQINVPLIVMSADNRWPSKMKALTLGACDYWSKPLHETQFDTMWTHVCKKYISESGDNMLKDTGKTREINNNSEIGLSMVHGGNGNFREVDRNVDELENSNLSSIRKNRVVWSEELHDAFVKAIEEVGIKNATPKKILEAMKISGLERAHVASHLQKYKKQLQQQQWNEMLLVFGDTKVNLPAAIPTNFHLGLTNNMVQNREEQLIPNIQFTDHFETETPNEMSLVSPNTYPITSAIHFPPAISTDFHANQALAHDLPFPDFPNTAITENFPMSIEALVALDDASIYKLPSLSDTVPLENPTTLHRNNMQQLSMIYHNQIQLMNFESSSIMISGNPSYNSLNTEPMNSAIHLSPAIPIEFHAEQALTHDPPFPDFSNTIIPENFPSSM